MKLGDLVLYELNYRPTHEHNAIGLVVGFKDFKGIRGHLFRQALVLWSPSGQIHACDLHSVRLLKNKTNAV